jgi:hypothetical protein
MAVEISFSPGCAGAPDGSKDMISERAEYDVVDVDGRK